MGAIANTPGSAREAGGKALLNVAVCDNQGDQISTFGGGTQYTEGDTDSTIAGTAVMWEDGSDTLRVASAAKPLPVEVVAGATSGTEYTEGDTDASIAGTAMLWEDAGDTLTPVNASKPLPVGDATVATNTGNAATSLAILDDWDESDRAKVNLIAGQAGITAGAGNVAANTPRMTLAADDPAVAALGTTAGAAVITDANGTVQQYLRGLVKLAITAGSFLVTATIAAKKVLWDAAAASQGTVLTTELNSLADAAFSGLGSEFDNTSGLHTYGWFEVNLASLNPTTGAFIQLFLVPALDGTNYPDAPSSTNPGTQYLIATLNIATGSATKRAATGRVALSPAKFKCVLYNDCNVALAASGNTVTLYTADKESQ